MESPLKGGGSHPSTLAEAGLGGGEYRGGGPTGGWAGVLAPVDALALLSGVLDVGIPTFGTVGLQDRLIALVSRGAAWVVPRLVAAVRKSQKYDFFSFYIFTPRNFKIRTARRMHSVRVRLK